MRSFAKSPRLDRQENPNNARVKKKTPVQKMMLVRHQKNPKCSGPTQPVLESSDVIPALKK
jgi:hypothetical protein